MSTRPVYHLVLVVPVEEQGEDWGEPNTAVASQEAEKGTEPVGPGGEASVGSEDQGSEALGEPVPVEEGALGEAPVWCTGCNNHDQEDQMSFDEDNGVLTGPPQLQQEEKGPVATKRPQASTKPVPGREGAVRVRRRPDRYQASWK